MSARSRVKPAGRSRRVIWAALAVALVAVVAIVALLLRSGDDEVAAPTGPGGHQLDRYPVPASKDLERSKAKRKQTTITACEALEPGGVRAMGTVENTGETDQDYAITVYFMRGDEPVNFADTRVSVPAGETVPWVAEKVFGTDDELTCRIAAVG